MKKISLLFIVLISFIGITSNVILNKDKKMVDFNLKFFSNNAFADAEEGYYPNCSSLGSPVGPNGGYWSKGNRTAETFAWHKYIKVGYSLEFGFFPSSSAAIAKLGGAVTMDAEVKNAIGYACDSLTELCCGITNAYVPD